MRPRTAAVLLLASCLLGSACEDPAARRQEAEHLGTYYRKNTRNVIRLQLLLLDEGHHEGAADGVMGPATRSALKDFQNSRGLEASGYAGHATWKRVESLLEERPCLNLKDIQLALLRAGLDPGQPDGVWGARTKGALEGFQRMQGLEPSGVIDQKTWKRLRGFLRPAGG